MIFKKIFICSQALFLHLRIQIFKYIVRIHVLYRMYCNNFFDHSAPHLDPSSVKIPICLTLWVVSKYLQNC